jgi:UTP--glucose-1-phosphate uridylyltransferase
VTLGSPTRLAKLSSDMATTLEDQLGSLPADVKDVLGRFNFDAEKFRELSARVASGAPEDNHVKAALSPPRESDLGVLPAAGTAEHERLLGLGRAALQSGQVALAVLAGGMATRMGGVVKALVEAVPGHTFLNLRLAEMEAICEQYARRPPLWLMVSTATEEPIRDALGAELDGDQVALFPQLVSLRLTPGGDIFKDAGGRPSEHAPGHGDFPEALQKSGLLQRFVERGGRVVMLTNLDNLGGTLDPLIIGWHLAHGDAVTCEVVDKLASDRGGVPVYVGDRLAVLEEFRIPPSFDPASVRVFATNVFHFDARALAELRIPWSFFRVNKQVDGKDVIQFERLVNEVTSHLPTRYLRVPREGSDSRFLPVKDNEELDRRVPEIQAVARARGMLGSVDSRR